MFGSRRHRAPNPPLTSATANPNATTAAAAVFKRHESNSSLSAAAAAAALRARPATPTCVADVQTKRTLRRSASIASTATGSDSHGRPTLQRRGSSGSMAERTFRSPSPHRPNSSGSAQHQSHSLSYNNPADMPPVPALPKNVEAVVKMSGSDARQMPPHRATNSLGMSTTPLYLASQKLESEDAPSWFGAAKMGDPGNVRRTDPAMASPPSSPPQEEQSVEDLRPNSRASSINFSYPTRARVGSPSASPIEPHDLVESPARTSRQHHGEDRRVTEIQGSRRHSSEPSASTRRRSVSASSDQTLVYDPNSRRMVRRGDLLAVEQAVLDASQQPTKTRKKKEAPQRAGTHLAQRTMGRTKNTSSESGQGDESRTTKTDSEFQPQATIKQPSARELQEDHEIPKVRVMAPSLRVGTDRLEQRTLESARQLFVSETATPESVASLPVTSLNQRSTVRRQPSTVKEEPDLEDSEPEKNTRSVIATALDTVPTRQRLFSGLDSESRHLSSTQSSSADSSLNPSLAASPTLISQASTHFSEIPAQNSASQAQTNASARAKTPQQGLRERTHSSSPARQAHFGSIQDNLMVKHSPPPRSISPRKSAMKHSSSPPRGASPSDDNTEPSGAVNPREEPPIGRKKSVRVSFDDENTVVVGESASTDRVTSPVPSSPQNTAGRRPWYSNIGRTKKDLASLDDDEVMKPRPALPSFGSVRDRKPREVSPVEGERPLVRPMTEATYSPPSPRSSVLLPSNSIMANDSKSGLETLGQSNDHGVGAILAKEQEERYINAANISRFREPLPPVVTSVEGSGYVSDSSTSPEFEESQVSHETTTAPAEPLHNAADAAVSYDAPAINPPAKIEGEGSTKATEDESNSSQMAIPTISISQPSPAITDRSKYFIEIPGGFPDDDSELSTPSATPTTAEIEDDIKRQAVLEPISQGPKLEAAPQTPQTPATPQVTQPATEQPPSDSESSIYSDAYEDLSEVEGDGFMSLDAVVESPISPVPRPELHSREISAKRLPVMETVPKLEPEFSVATTVIDTQPAGAPQDDWEKAKTFWKSLTADKRAQLEREAMEDAGIEADREEEKSPEKPRKKKSIERRNSERKALAVHLAQQMIVQQGKQKAPNPERSYMIKPGTKWADNENENNTHTMRTTLRAESPQQSTAIRNGEAPRLRKSMRTGSSARNSESLQPAARIVATESERPTSLPAQAIPVQNTGRRQGGSKTAPQTDAGASKPSYVPPPIKRRDSTSSESSFKRLRSASSGQGFSFRQSMRQTSPSPVQANVSSNKRFSLRTLSPSGSQFRQPMESSPVSTTASPQIRRTLRDTSSEVKASTGMRMPNFGLSSGGKKSGGKWGVKHKSSGSRLSSRFADSSDEDGAPGLSGFRSRFEDSSDDEIVAPMPMPMPMAVSKTSTLPGHIRNQNSVASTALPEELEESEELPDSSENEKQPGEAKAGPLAEQPRGAASTELRRSRSGRGQIVSSQTAPALGTSPGVVGATERRNSTASKRSSFMSVLRRKKHPSIGKIARPEVIESAARRDTKLERSADQLRDIRAAANAKEEDVDEPQRSPKLQKRVLSSSRITGTMPGERLFGTGTAAGLGDEKEFEAPKRPSTSGNLGTRTLSAGNVLSAHQQQQQQQQQQQPGFLQNRTLSLGVMSLDTGLKNAAGTGTAAGTAAAATSTPTRKKRFGALRKMFGLDD